MWAVLLYRIATQERDERIELLSFHDTDIIKRRSFSCSVAIINTVWRGEDPPQVEWPASRPWVQGCPNVFVRSQCFTPLLTKGNFDESLRGNSKGSYFNNILQYLLFCSNRSLAGLLWDSCSFNLDKGHVYKATCLSKSRCNVLPNEATSGLFLSSLLRYH